MTMQAEARDQARTAPHAGETLTFREAQARRQAQPADVAPTPRLAPVLAPVPTPPRPAAPAPRPAPFHPALADVLAVLVEAAAPVPHNRIVKALVKGGQEKKSAKEAIAACQKRGWIEHNLLTGYILGGSADVLEGDDE